MKKIKLLFITIICVMCLTSCNQITQTQTQTQIVTKIEEEVEVTQIQSQITEAYRQAEKGCVGIYVSNGISAGIGSGVIYNKDGLTYYVVTNAHVVEKMTNIKIYFGDEKYLDADLIGYDTKNDVAVLSFTRDSSNINASDLYVHDLFNYEDIDSLTIGQTVLAIGCPLDLENYNVLTTGVVSHYNYSGITHDASINPGNSGGGLFNLSGRLIGLNTSKETTTTTSDGVVTLEGRGHAISFHVLKKCIQDIINNGTNVERPLLGISVTSFNTALDSDTYEKYKMYLPDGDTRNGYVLVTGFADVSAAKSCGVLEGDLLIKINDNDIYSTTIISQVLAITTKDDIVKLTVYRKTTNSMIDINVIFS